MRLDEIIVERTIPGPLVEPGRIGPRAQRPERDFGSFQPHRRCEGVINTGSSNPTPTVAPVGADTVDLPPFAQERRGHQ